MEITIPNVVVSILNTNDSKYAISKLKELENLLTLNEVENRILLDIYEGHSIGKMPTPAFIKQKYSYVFDEYLFDDYLNKDAVDSAILQIKIVQAKQSLKLNLLDISSGLDSLPPEELKDKIALLLENDLLTSKTETPTNHMVPVEDAYSLLVSSDEGMTLGNIKIEEHAGKAKPATVVTILAFAGSFKSTYALQLAYLNALQNYNVLYLSLESTADLLKQRLVINHIASTVTNRDELIDGKWIRDGKLTKPLQEVYNKYHNDLMTKLDGRLILWDETDIEYNTFLEMNNTLKKADNLFKENTGKGLDAVVLDQLALLKFTRAGGKRYTYDGAVLNDWMSYFRKQSLNFLDTGREITAFVVSQINRESYLEASKPKKKGRYDITAASDANEIERASSTMITLYKDLDTKNTLLVNIPKAREGYVPDDPIQLEVYGEYSHIGPLKVGNLTLDASDFDAEEFTLDDLID